MAKIDLIYFVESLERHQQVLAKMKADLEEYALNPKSSETAIAYRNNLIARLALFEEIAENTVNTLADDNQNSFSAGYSKGYKKALAEMRQIPDKYAHPEQYREYMKLQAIHDFPHLY